jgi:hypothetical protein
MKDAITMISSGTHQYLTINPTIMNVDNMLFTSFHHAGCSAAGKDIYVFYINSTHVLLFFMVKG